MKRICILLLFVMIPMAAKAQEVGLAFSYFIPKKGYFSAPVSPFSIRGVGFDLSKALAIESGFSLYRMSGLGLTDIPIDSNDPLVGPNFTLLVPVELVLRFPGRGVEFDIKGGGFAFVGFGQKINYGNLDRALRTAEGWDVANASVSGKNKPGLGYHFGAELTIDINRQFGISLETNYLAGSSSFALTGDYRGGTLAGPLETRTLDYPDARIDLTGFEFSIGVIFNTR
jgi:hypothetical protein